MRTAPGFVTLVIAAAAAADLAAGCGGGARKPPTPIANTIAAPPDESWTLDRALATVPTDAAVVAWADVGRLRNSEILAPYVDQLAAFARSSYQVECDLKFSGSVLAIASGPSRPNTAIWAFDFPTDALRTCLRDNPRPEVEVVGDDIRITKGHDRMAVRLLDDKTLIGVIIKRDGDAAAAADAAIERESTPASFPEVDALRSSGAPLWAFGNAPATPAALKFRTMTLTASATDKLALDVTVHMAEADQAKVLEGAVKQQGQTIIGMGFATSLDAHADGDALIVHAEADKASIDKMIQMATMFANTRGGTNPLLIPRGPIAPTP